MTGIVEAAEMLERAVHGVAPRRRPFVIDEVGLQRPAGFRDLIGSAIRRRLTRAASTASRVALHNNVIASYPDAGVVAKQFRDPRRTQAYTEGLAHAKRLFRFVRVPHLVAEGTHPAAFVIEEHIRGVRPTAGQLAGVAESITDDLTRLHLEGAAIEPLHVPGSRVRAWRDDLLREGFDVPEIVRRFADSGFACEVVVGPTHGDLHPSNFLLADATLYLIDWEWFGTGPLAREIHKSRRILPRLADVHRTHCSRIAAEARTDLPSMQTQIAADCLRTVPNRQYWDQRGRPDRFRAWLADTAAAIAAGDPDELQGMGPSAER